MRVYEYPMVVMKLVVKEPSENLRRRQLLPTPKKLEWRESSKCGDGRMEEKQREKRRKGENGIPLSPMRRSLMR